MTLPNAPSFLQRRADARRQPERQILGRWIADNLISPGARLFVVSGTTAAEAAEVVLQRVDSVHVVTNSLPVAWAFLHLIETGKAAPHASVSITGGDLRPITGIIAGKIKIEKNAALLLSPHGITEKGITGDRDVDQLKPLLNGYRRVIMPISWSKLNREGASAVKHFGHWKQVQCEIVITERPHEDLGIGKKDHENGSALLNTIAKVMGKRLILHRVPLS